MYVIGVCGPIGSKIEEFAKQFAALAIEMTQKTRIIYEEDHANSLGEINFTTLSQQLNTEDTSIVLVVGNHIFRNQEMLLQCNVKVFLETGGDTCLTNYIRESPPKESEKRIDHYLDKIKPANENYINKTKKYADLVVPETAKFKCTFELLLVGVREHVENLSRSEPEERYTLI